MKKIIIFCLVIILCVALRIYKLGDFPDGIHIDEAAFGYNAYSILKTGKDQFGNTFPLFFESEGDYKLPVHVYLSIPAIALFGLNSFSVRLTTLIMSCLLVVLIFILTHQITNSYKKSVLAAFLLSISPWHFLFSRQGTEVVTCAVFACLSLIFYIKYHKHDKLIYLFLFLLMSMAAMLTYRTATMFIVIFYFFLMIVNFKTYVDKSQKKLIIFSYLTLLLLFIFLSSSLLKRYSAISLSSSEEVQNIINLNLREDGVFPRSIDNLYLPRLLHNKAENLVLSIQKNFWSQLDLSVLFFKGDSLNNAIPDVGNQYFFEVVFFIVFVLIALSLYKKNKYYIIPLLWIFASIFSSSFAVDAVNSSRTMQAVMGYVLAITIGLLVLLNMINNQPIKIFMKIVIVFLYFLGSVFMLHQYFVHKPLRTPWYRDVGLNEAVSYIENHKSQYKKVVFGNDIYTLYAYRAKSDPATIQKRVKGITDNREKRRMKNLDDKFVTDPQNCNFKEGEMNVLYVCFGRKIPMVGQIIKTFTFRDGQPNLTLYEYNPKSKVNLPNNMEFY